jgi:glutamate--cysteine ligase
VSLDRRGAPELERPIGSVAELAGWLRSGEKESARFRIGAEYEKIGLWADTYEPVPYEGPRGIGSVLERIAELDGWAPVEERGALVALERNGASITIEPGGQLELSGLPLGTLHDVSAEFEDHLDVLRRASEPLGIVWLGLGFSCCGGGRCAPHAGALSHHAPPAHAREAGAHMMHLTATVQANLDFSDESDMQGKLRAGGDPDRLGVFANSPLAGAARAASSRAASTSGATRTPTAAGSCTSCSTPTSATSATSSGRSTSRCSSSCATAPTSPRRA